MLSGVLQQVLLSLFLLSALYLDIPFGRRFAKCAEVGAFLAKPSSEVSLNSCRFIYVPPIRGIFPNGVLYASIMGDALLNFIEKFIKQRISYPEMTWLVDISHVY